jgi:hypothetical protein
VDQATHNKIVSLNRAEKTHVEIVTRVSELPFTEVPLSSWESHEVINQFFC